MTHLLNCYAEKKPYYYARRIGDMCEQPGTTCTKCFEMYNKGYRLTKE